MNRARVESALLEMGMSMKPRGFMDIPISSNALSTLALFITPPPSKTAVR